MKALRTPTDVSLKARLRGSVGLNIEHAQYELSRMLAEISGDARYIESIYALLSRSIAWSLFCYGLKARDHYCVLCDVTRDLLFTWYIAHQPRFLPLPDLSRKIERDSVRRVDQLSSVRLKKHTEQMLVKLPFTGSNLYKNFPRLYSALASIANQS